MKYLQLQNLSQFPKIGIFLLMAVLTVVGCDTVSNDNASRTPVTLRIQTVQPANSMGFANITTQQTGDTLSIAGNNGTLFITDVHFIVDDFELEKAEGECEGLEGKNEDACEEFEAELIFVDLPLGTDSLELSATPVKNGVYSELEFEVDDLDLDEPEDSTEMQKKEELLTEIRTQFADWPESASMVISGWFVSNTSTVTEFTTYAEAEVSVEMELTPPLDIDGSTSKYVTININPATWFVRGDGSVINLANYDFSLTNEILDFEVEIENGFISTEVEQD